MSLYKKFDKGSGVLFFAGVFFSRITVFISAPFIGQILGTLGMGLYSIAYLLWITASLLHPKISPQKTLWFNTISYPRQFILAAVIGLAAAGVAITAIFFPIAALPAYWLFAISNAIWCVGEYHKKQFPPSFDPSYQAEKQNRYLQYAAIVSAISLFTALIFTVGYFITPVLIFAFVITPYLGGFSFRSWLNAIIPSDTKSSETPSIAPSYSKVPSTTPKSTATESPSLSLTTSSIHGSPLCSQKPNPTSVPISPVTTFDEGVQTSSPA
ncbi:MAG: hypothetical protein Q8R79_00315 [Legionellaceae bacterium]|nr:hypothetical protein [Legionellaceae bacterium]